LKVFDGNLAADEEPGTIPALDVSRPKAEVKWESDADFAYLRPMETKGRSGSPPRASARS
jgi:hypothetical protein